MDAPALDRGQVAFLVSSRPPQGEALPAGVYLFDPLSMGLKTIAQEGTSIPGTTTTFASFGAGIGLSGVSLDRGIVAFTGGDAEHPEPEPPLVQGIYTGTGGPLRKVTDNQLGFERFGVPSIDAGNVVFRAFGSGLPGPDSTGIYADLGSGIRVVADTRTAVPDRSGLPPGILGHFSFFTAAPTLVGTSAVFAGLSELPSGALFGGIYLAGLGSPIPDTSMLVDALTLVPGSSERFGVRSFQRSPAFDGTSVAFWGEGNSSGESGIFTNAGGSLRAVADTDTFAPGSSIRFSSFDNFPAIDLGRVAFVGRSAPGPGIYLDIDGELSEVVTARELNMELGLPDVFNELSLFHEALSGNQIAFWARSDGGEFIIVATAGAVPAPPGLLVMTLGLGVMLFLRRAHLQACAKRLSGRYTSRSGA